MADDFRILDTGTELSSNGRNNSNQGGSTNWWLLGIGITSALIIVAGAGYYLGRQSIAPQLAAATNEKEIANNAAQKQASTTEPKPCAASPAQPRS